MKLQRRDSFKWKVEHNVIDLEELTSWTETNCPQSIRGTTCEFEGGSKAPIKDPDFQRWFEACVERGLTVPDWPTEYGGAGLDPKAAQQVRAVFQRKGAPLPLKGTGMAMIGPTLLEYGTDEQKSRHLPRIARGEVRWCQGYSEPGAGSDLASLSTRAQNHGDHYLINGSKIWTSDAHLSDWMFCLVRTDFDAPKHDGISFVLFPMDDPGVTVKRIELISGSSPFCECFFDDVKADRNDLIGEENQGWSVGKRLLQHERSSVSGGGGGIASAIPIIDGTLIELMQHYAPNDHSARENVLSVEMDDSAFQLTLKRVAEEQRIGGTESSAGSTFKYLFTEFECRRSEAIIAMMGTQGLGWTGDDFREQELRATRTWLEGRAMTIAAGSSEIQLNIIAKRVLGLPD